MSASDPSKLIKVGAVGMILVALCCFTPILVILLGVVGLSALTGYLDVVLFPALAAFISLTIYAIVRERKAEACRAPGATGDKS